MFLFDFNSFSMENNGFFKEKQSIKKKRENKKNLMDFEKKTEVTTEEKIEKLEYFGIINKKTKRDLRYFLATDERLFSGEKKIVLDIINDILNLNVSSEEDLSLKKNKMEKILKKFDEYLEKFTPQEKRNEDDEDTIAFIKRLQSKEKS